jgi:hypothetical protein
VRFEVGRLRFPLTPGPIRVALTRRGPHRAGRVGGRHRRGAGHRSRLAALAATETRRAALVARRTYVACRFAYSATGFECYPGCTPELDAGEDARFHRLLGVHAVRLRLTRERLQRQQLLRPRAVMPISPGRQRGRASRRRNHGCVQRSHPGLLRRVPHAPGAPVSTPSQVRPANGASRRRLAGQLTWGLPWWSPR